MSLYNMLCGNNPLFGILARILCKDEPLPYVPRFRDMYTRMEGEQVQIVIFTRTGGGNRESHESENDLLARHPLYVCDFDDDYDSTFAHFVFRVPDEFQEALSRWHEAFHEFPKCQAPMEKFRRAMGAIEGKDIESPEIPGGEQLERMSEITHELMRMVSDSRCSLEEQLNVR